MKNIHNFRLDKNSILILPHISTYKGNICYRIKTTSIVKRKTLNYRNNQLLQMKSDIIIKKITFFLSSLVCNYFLEWEKEKTSIHVVSNILWMVVLAFSKSYQRNLVRAMPTTNGTPCQSCYWVIHLKVIVL